jgi:hypothetical protein
VISGISLTDILTHRIIDHVLNDHKVSAKIRNYYDYDLLLQDLKPELLDFNYDIINDKYNDSITDLYDINEFQFDQITFGVFEDDEDVLFYEEYKEEEIDYMVVDDCIDFSKIELIYPKKIKVQTKSNFSYLSKMINMHSLQYYQFLSRYSLEKYYRKVKTLTLYRTLSHILSPQFINNKHKFTQLSLCHFIVKNAVVDNTETDTVGLDIILKGKMLYYATMIKENKPIVKEGVVIKEKNDKYYLRVLISYDKFKQIYKTQSELFNYNMMGFNETRYNKYILSSKNINEDLFY